MHPTSLGRKAAAPSRLASLIAPVALLATATAPLLAQTANPCKEGGTRTACSDYRQFHSVTRTFYLTNVTGQNDANEVLVALRNLLDPSIKLYLVASQNAIVMRALPEDFDTAEHVIADLTRPRKTFRVVFTINTFDGTRKVSSEHVSVDALAGQRSVLKQGRKVPVATGSLKTGNEDSTQFQYIDVGTNLDVTLTDTGKGLLLKSKIEESSVGEEKPAGINDPVIHQAVLESTTALMPGKSVDLGSVDLTGTTQHLTVEATAEPLS